MHFFILFFHAFMDSWKDSSGIIFSYMVMALLIASMPPKWGSSNTFFSFGNKTSCKEPVLVNTLVVLAVGCCFWPNTAGCLGPCEPERYQDEGSKTCFSTFLAFLFALLRAGTRQLTDPN